MLVFTAALSFCRCFNRLDAYDAQRNLARVSFQGAAMTIETRVLAMDTLELRIGSMYQFLGETYQVRNVRAVHMMYLIVVALMSMHPD